MGLRKEQHFFHLWKCISQSQMITGLIQIKSRSIKTFTAAQSLINQGAAINGRWLALTCLAARVSSSYWARWLDLRDAKQKFHADLDKNYLLSSYSVSDAALLQVFCWYGSQRARGDEVWREGHGGGRRRRQAGWHRDDGRSVGEGAVTTSLDLCRAGPDRVEENARRVRREIWNEAEVVSQIQHFTVNAFPVETTHRDGKLENAPSKPAKPWWKMSKDEITGWCLTTQLACDAHNKRHPGDKRGGGGGTVDESSSFLWKKLPLCLLMRRQPQFSFLASFCHFFNARLFCSVDRFFVAVTRCSVGRQDPSISARTVMLIWQSPRRARATNH